MSRVRYPEAVVPAAVPPAGGNERPPSIDGPPFLGIRTRALLPMVRSRRLWRHEDFRRCRAGQQGNEEGFVRWRRRLKALLSAGVSPQRTPSVPPVQEDALAEIEALIRERVDRDRRRDVAAAEIDLGRRRLARGGLSDALHAHIDRGAVVRGEALRVDGADVDAVVEDEEPLRGPEAVEEHVELSERGAGVDVRAGKGMDDRELGESHARVRRSNDVDRNEQVTVVPPSRTLTCTSRSSCPRGKLKPLGALQVDSA